MTQRAALLRPVPVLEPLEWTAKELPRGTLRPYQPAKHRGSVFPPDRPVPVLQTTPAKKP